MNVWLQIALVLGVLGLGAAAVRHYQLHHAPSPESTRKALHVFGGVLAVGLPWLFSAVWPVLLLCAVVALALVIVRCSPALRRGIGSTIHGVGRRSCGELCFPIGIAVVFAAAGGDRVPFVVSVLPLTLADPAAALVGLRYGRHRFHVAGEAKTLEGSAAFFIVALACAVALLVGTGADVPSISAIALFALALTVVEAVAPRGLDNLLIPVAGALAFNAWLRVTAG